MTIKDYLTDKIYTIIGFFAILLINSFLLLCIDVKMKFILLFDFGWILFFVGIMIVDAIKKKTFFKKLASVDDETSYKSCIPYLRESNNFLEAKVLLDTVVAMEDNMAEQINLMEKATQENQEYIELWVHEIKTPLSALNLMLCNKSEDYKGMEAELDRINRQLEQALYYIRGSSLEKDFLLQKVSLDEIVGLALKNNAKELIRHKAQIERQHLEEYVYTDKKWLKFILEQIIVNSIKYSTNKPLKLDFGGETIENAIKLSISDNGCGIKKEDLGRVFDKGFCGSNGREHNHSTGIGLYLVKQMTERMKIGIQIESEYQEWTEVTLTFPVGSYTEF